MIAVLSGFDHPILVCSGFCAGLYTTMFSHDTGSGAASRDEQTGCLAAGFEVQYIGMFPALSAKLLSHKCASHHGTNVIPEIS